VFKKYQLWIFCEQHTILESVSKGESGFLRSAMNPNQIICRGKGGCETHKNLSALERSGKLSGVKRFKIAEEGKTFGNWRKFNVSYHRIHPPDRDHLSDDWP